MRSVVLGLCFVLACGDNETFDDDVDTGSDPGPQIGGLEVCGVEGPDDEAADCFLSGGGAFNADINGDSNPDLIVGSPYSDVGGVVDAGAVFIFFGPNFTTQAPQILTQNMAGSGDAAEAYDRFGWSVTAFNVSGRGKTDLIVGVPYEDVGGLVDAGALSVFHGPLNFNAPPPHMLEPSKLAGFPAFITQDMLQLDVADPSEAGDLFGFSLAWGAVRPPPTGTNNSPIDLAIGIPGEDLNGAVDAGAVVVLQEGMASPRSTTLVGTFIHQGLPGMNAQLESGDQFGWSVAIAQTAPGTQITTVYLAVGVPGEDIGTIADAGSVHVLPPSPTGPTPIGSQAWHQDVAGIYGVCEAGDRFGEVLHVRETGTDTVVPDLFVGVPHEDLLTPTGTNAADAGMVHLIPALDTGYGLTATGNRTFTQADSSGSPPTETIEPYDRFGSVIAGGGFRAQNSVPADMIISAPYEAIGSTPSAGVIHYLKQNNGVFAQADSRVISIADTPGMIPAAGDRFGFGISVWRFQTMLMVGVPGRAAGGTFGMVLGYGLLPMLGGVNPAATKTLTVNTAGGTSTPNEQFGRVFY